MKRSADARLGLLRRQLKEYGPLYVVAVVPDYARRDFEMDQYGAWYMAHTDVAQLDDEVLNGHFGSFKEECPDFDPVELMESFMAWLEDKVGYVVLHTAGDGVVVIDTEEEL